ncbi:DUF6663 family protein [Halorarius litoreus]|uniref:DUF6663 family protein n=1 Tax=Halorarius litoreus TaxID=2962676 RepID=UPI0020CE2741|nr:DUF6663 family protein [Halorarius litoreus]
MEQTTAGTFRVLASTRGDDEWLLLDVESGDPTYVPATGYEGALAETAADLEAGNRVDAELAWSDGQARFAALTITAPTRFYFIRTTETLFEAAKRCWNDAVEEGSGMNSRVTYGTDSEPNGIVYTFAEQPGQRDLFEEFRDGVKPLEPLLVRAAGGREAYDTDDGPEPPFETFVLSHPDHPFVTVYIVLDPDGFLAETVRDTYLDGDGSAHDDEDDVGGLADRL